MWFTDCDMWFSMVLNPFCDLWNTNSVVMSKGSSCSIIHHVLFTGMFHAFTVYGPRKDTFIGSKKSEKNTEGMQSCPLSAIQASWKCYSKSVTVLLTMGPWEKGYSNPASSYKRAMPTKPIKKEKKFPNFNNKASIFIKRVVVIAKNLVPQTKKFTILLRLFPCG